MRHFDFLNDDDRARLFFRAPQDFSTGDVPPVLAMALGASLYSPATRPKLCTELLRSAARGVTSVVVCLEDAVRDADLAAAERNAIDQLRQYAATGAEGPMIFIRVRSASQIPMIVNGLGPAQSVLTGFVVPKFTDDSGAPFLDAVLDVSAGVGRRLFVMPVLESPEIAHVESRLPALLATRSLLDKYRSHVLAVRIGATDLSSPFGLRRSRDMTVYDVRVLADVISDVVNVFARIGRGVFASDHWLSDGVCDEAQPYLVTGPVWEYFSGSERLFKPQLRESPFRESDERELRARLIASDLDALIREVVLDKANGLTGKTVIHPSHVAAVHALSVVTHEEYLDAVDVVGTLGGGGVAASAYQNKMNESKPHSSWAQRILLRAHVFGVAAAEISLVDLLGASLAP